MRRSAFLGAALWLAATLASPQEPAAVLARINDARSARQQLPVRWDTVAAPILHDLLRRHQGSGPTPTQVYAQVAEARGYPASGGAYRTWRGGSVDEVLEQALAAPQLLAPGHSHVAVAVERLAAGGAAAALFLTTLPLPDGAATRAGENRIFLCPSCRREWPRLTDERPGRGCPRCDLLREGYIDDSQGRFHWASWFAHPFAPFPVSNPYLAWKWTNEAVRYSHVRARDNLPGWQTPAETARLKAGVCRDTSALLAAWLRSMDVDARVVTGFYGDAGHAWVVMSDGEHRYLMETAGGGTLSRRYPPRLELATGYVPAELMFDDRHVWLNRGRNRVHDYLSAAIWAEVKEAP